MLETSIGAVSRVKSFSTGTGVEALPNEVTPPPENWPLSGRIEFKNVSASYKSVFTHLVPTRIYINTLLYRTADIDNKALDNLTFSVRGGEKFGICGRSGSGKSSFILALFRMIEISSGTMLIDGIDLSTIPRQEIRAKLNAISQDPYFIAGTIRLNLDPYASNDDTALISALQKVQLYDTIMANGGLDADLDLDSLSHGQRQLFCLARAMLRKGKIIVLDEATSSVDRKTDELMQRIIREEFKDHTVIAVAHRLETILDFDRIAVLDRGMLRECDTPKNLLASKTAFRELYDVYSSSKEDSGEAE